MNPIFSPEDADLTALKWYGKIYAYRRFESSKFTPAHHVVCERVFGRKPDWSKREVCDHINGNKLDNRRENLRIVPQRINVVNSRKFRSEGPRYAQRIRQSERWACVVGVNGKHVHVGTFNSPEESKAAALAFIAEKTVTIPEPQPNQPTFHSIMSANFRISDRFPVPANEFRSFGIRAAERGLSKSALMRTLALEFLESEKASSVKPSTRKPSPKRGGKAA